MGEMFEEEKSVEEIRAKMVRFFEGASPFSFLFRDPFDICLTIRFHICLRNSVREQEQQLSLKPWDGMDMEAMKSIVDEVIVVLTPLVEAAQASLQNANAEAKAEGAAADS